MSASLNLLDWLSFSISFAVVLGLLGLVLFGLKKMQNGGLLGLPQRRIRVLEMFSTGPRQKLILVRVKDQEILIGLTVQQMTTLAAWTLSAEELDAEPDAAPASGQRTVPAPLAKLFADLLKSAGNGLQNKDRSR